MSPKLLLLLCVATLTKAGPSVVIIGAGPSGIAAASKLLENGITNITILEAEDRIGGRIKSVKFGDKFVDVGAEYCHGQENNVVYELVKDLDVLEPLSNELKFPLFYSNGSELDGGFIDELKKVMIGYDDGFGKFNASGGNLGELFEKKYNGTIIQRYTADKEKLKILKEALRLAEKVTLMIDGAFSWLDTSTVKHYERCNGHQFLVWKGRGYRTVLQVLMKEYPDPQQKLPIDDKIHLNTEVVKIDWSQTQVIVKTNNNKSFEADHVIFTPSVGVLKDQKDVLFHPTLPAKKKRAIEAIGIAGVMKILLNFETEWWKSDDVSFTFLWNEQDYQNSGTEFTQGPTIEGISWVTSLTTMLKVPGNPKVLIIWVAGNFIPEMEKTPDGVLKEGCVYVLNKFLGRYYNVTEPDGILKSSWRSNPHFRGTYSYERAGFEREGVRYQADLAESLENGDGKPLVLFAGEATNPVHYSTVHGAIETGFREAERIINLYK